MEAETEKNRVVWNCERRAFMDPGAVQRYPSSQHLKDWLWHYQRACVHTCGHTCFANKKERETLLILLRP